MIAPCPPPLNLLQDPESDHLWGPMCKYIRRDPPLVTYNDITGPPDSSCGAELLFFLLWVAVYFGLLF